MLKKHFPEETEEVKHKYDSAPRFGERHIQIALLFAMLTTGYTTRMSIYVAIVAMVGSNKSSNSNIPSFNWTNSNVILSSFFWGYITFQVVGAHFIKKYGAKWFFLAGCLMNATVTVLTPAVSIRFGSTGIIVCRIVQGLSQGLFLPTAHTVLGIWAPPNERARLGTFAISSIGAGTIIGELATGYIAASWVGWPASYYIFGGLCFAACLLWFFYAHNSPASHPHISQQEREYIESSLRVQQHSEIPPTPWKAIFTSVPFWALMICNICCSWNYQTLISETPTYLSKILGFDIKSNGFVSSGPSILAWFTAQMFGYLADTLIEKKYFSTTNVRRLFQLVSTIPSAVCITILGYMPENQEMICVLLLFLSSCFLSGNVPGYGLNHLDLSPTYGGILQAITNSTAAAISIFAPLYVQLVVNDDTDVMQWRQVFVTSAISSLLGAVIFTIFASGERQWWDSSKNDSGKKTSDSSVLERDRKISSISALEGQFI